MMWKVSSDSYLFFTTNSQKFPFPFCLWPAISVFSHNYDQETKNCPLTCLLSFGGHVCCSHYLCNNKSSCSRVRPKTPWHTWDLAKEVLVLGVAEHLHTALPPKAAAYLQMFRKEENVVSKCSAVCTTGHFFIAAFMSAANLLSLNLILLIITSRVVKIFYSSSRNSNVKNFVVHTFC